MAEYQVASRSKHLPLNGVRVLWGPALLSGISVTGNYLHCITGQALLTAGSHLNSTHTAASDVTAMSVLKGEKEVRDGERDLQPVSSRAAQ